MIFRNMNTIGKVMSGISEGYACGTLHVLSYLFSIEVLASFVPEAEVGMVAGIRGSCPDGSRLVSSDDVGHPLFDGGKS